MIFYFSPYIVVLVICAIISAVLAAYVWRRRASPGAVYFILLMACAAEWSLAGALKMVSPDLQAKIICTQLSYLSVVFIGPLWVLFALDYSRHREWITGGKTTLLCIIPLVTLAFVLTNGWHGLVWPQVTLASNAPEATPIYQHGIVYWIHTAYSYALLFLGYCILAITAIRSTGRERLLIMTILACVAAMWAGSMPYAITGAPLVDADLTPVAMTVTGFLLAWLIFQKRLFDIVPVAREKLIASMCDGVIVINDEGLVVEINPAARELTGARDGDIGKPAAEVLKQWPDLSRCCTDGAIGAPAEILMDGQGGPKWLDIRISPLQSAGSGQAGRLIVMRDITELRRRGEELKRSHESLQAEMWERKKAEEQIRHSLQEKEVLLKEIHHRVKNNLQIISSLLSLQAGTSSKESAAAFTESQNRIRSMALIHEKLYQSSNLSRIDFGGYVSGLMSHLVKSYAPGPGISVDIDIEDIALDIDLAIPCGLIINELASNSLKYAFKDGRQGNILIRMEKTGSLYTLTVGDDGVGLPRILDFRDSPSLGLQLVNTLVDQLEGTIELGQDTGTTFKITFKEITHKEMREPG
ncbi:histidine kinase N-terminal 7TM domain-containing protein [Methanocella arvoryzae]|nr:histidine kinase N-terminal 7TM domain-containing protein [Methanocella arvoryzae]